MPTVFPRNVLGGPLQTCSRKPLTGFLRDGCCSSAPGDRGLHLVCVEVTAEFLEFSVEQGNDLVTPVPEYAFPGLTPGGRWCLCVERWKRRGEAGGGPQGRSGSDAHPTLEFVDRGPQSFDVEATWLPEGPSAFLRRGAGQPGHHEEFHQDSAICRCQVRCRMAKMRGGSSFTGNAGRMARPADAAVIAECFVQRPFLRIRPRDDNLKERIEWVRNCTWGNLSYNTTSQSLQQVFGEHGEVRSAEVVMDRRNGPFEGLRVRRNG